MRDIIEIEDAKIPVTINGEQKECDVLFTYDEDETGFALIGYTDNTTNEKGELNIYVSKYSIFNPNELMPVTDPKELAIVDEAIAEAKKLMQ